MGMIFCRGCGHQIHDSAVNCPKCGAPNAVTGSGTVSPSVATVEIPDGIKGWSWGAFLLNWIWAIGNRTWIGLLALIPYVGFIMAIILGIKGREWAWKNKQWDSVEHFNAVQRKWSMWGGIVVGVVFVVGILAAIAIPAYEDYKSRAQEISLLDQPAEETVNVQRSSEPVAAMPVSSPYPLPQLAFGKIEFLTAVKQIGMEAHWESEFVSYLSNPQAFWDKCVAGGAFIAQELGNMNPAEARAHGEAGCQGTTAIYYQCLNGTRLDDAVMCLQQHINEAAEGGD